MADCQNNVGNIARHLPTRTKLNSPLTHGAPCASTEEKAKIYPVGRSQQIILDKTVSFYIFDFEEEDTKLSRQM